MKPLCAIAISACLIALTSCVPSLTKVTANQANEQLAAMPKKDWHYSKSARSKIRKAYQSYTFRPEYAAACFLTAAHDLEPHRSRSEWAYRAYQHALGMGTELINKHQLWGQTIEHPELSIALPKTVDCHELGVHKIDELHFSGRFATPGMDPAIERKGPGAPMLATTYASAQSLDRHPFMSMAGYIQSATALADWHPVGESQVRLTLELRNPKKSSQLAANFTDPVAFYDMKTKSLITSGLQNVWRPNNGLSQMGLYNTAPIDPKKTPIVFIHGLAATPNLWLKPVHAMMRNPEFRKKYQIYVFYYPTGFPISQNANHLKQELIKLQKARLTYNNKPEKMVLVGHSMGGLLTSVVTRDFEGEFERLSRVSIEELKATEKVKETLQGLVREAPIDFIDKAIFLGTPHKGSPYASNWIGRVSSHFVRIPKSLLEIDPSSYKHDLSQFGQSLWDIDQNLDGIYSLELNHPVLLYIESRPKIDGVTYYSIIGDRGWGGDLEKSSDGLVPYTSSSINNDESECVVPSWHNLQKHPDAIAEVLKILEL
ncbi:esterase/lipase family protein [Rubritalea marina]|uniref:esterase/lipase family protein n=1 Tax=Rubritalea marina TaxID=361055 RepID=UPI000378688D|nr:hypothetical protein [Rubritalea marina]